MIPDRERERERENLWQISKYKALGIKNKKYTYTSLCCKLVSQQTNTHTYTHVDMISIILCRTVSGHCCVIAAGYVD